MQTQVKIMDHSTYWQGATTLTLPCLGSIAIFNHISSSGEIMMGKKGPPDFVVIYKGINETKSRSFSLQCNDIDKQLAS